MNTSFSAPVPFDVTFEKISKTMNKAEVPFNPLWANGTGYYDYAVKGEHMVHIPVGEMKTCVSDNGRKMIFIGTPLGPVVVFQRNICNSDTIVLNMAPKFDAARIVIQGRLSGRDQIKLLGDGAYRENIGNWLANVKELFTEDAVTEFCNRANKEVFSAALKGYDVSHSDSIATNAIMDAAWKLCTKA